ncbi:MAG: hypothetical protein QGI83_14620, partial [Candidatus Latescibacteria bacterium]|nr:hypothetical protein [Candidatus Latescibacterota bacterium]
MTIEHPRHLELETPLCAGHPVTVAAPRSPHGRATADRIHQALRDIGADATLAEDPAFEALSEAAGPVIVVGNLADSQCIRGLYFRFMCATDLWYPGPGGYELRTLCNPFGTGHNALLVGYSDAEGTTAGCEALLDRLADPVPHLADLHVTRLPVSGQEVEQTRAEPLASAAWQRASSTLGDHKGYLYYLTGERELGEGFRATWKAIVECGYAKTDRMVQVHLTSLSHWLPWRLVEDMNLFGEQERLDITRYLYGWAESDEGHKHVAHCPRVVSMHVPRQNHELIPALALMHAAHYFSTYFPDLPGPSRWLEP